jgi:hypothetical protein
LTKLLLSFLAIALMVADIYLTNKILAKGGKELNPLMKWCMDKLGESWMMPKVIFTLCVLAVFFTFPSSAPLIAICVAQGAIVLWNVKEYWKGK